MGKGLTCLVIGLGAAAFEGAAYELNLPGLGDYTRDLAHALVETDGYIIGPFVGTMFDHFKNHLRETHSGWGFIGAAGQVTMWGGIGNLIYKALEPKEGKKE